MDEESQREASPGREGSGGSSPLEGQRTPDLRLVTSVHDTRMTNPNESLVEQHAERRRLRMIAQDIQMRRSARDTFIKTAIFGEPAWDMLLALYVAELTRERYTVTQVASYSGGSASTALRWISCLESEGYIRQWPHLADGRCHFLGLTNKARAELDAYFQNIDSLSGHGTD